MDRDETQSLAKTDQGAAIANAVLLWAGASTGPETWDRAYKVRDKVGAVNRFLAFAGKHPGEVTPTDVDRWRAHLEAQGYKPATVYARISRLSSFYKWLMQHPELSALIRSNPVEQARPRSPRPYQSDAVKSWSDEEAGAIL